MIDIYVLKGIDEVKRNLSQNDITIVIDVIRCGSTIIAGLQNGGKRFIPVTSIKDVREAVKRNPRYISAGERGGAKVEWFDLGNSPTEMVPDTVSGRTIVMTTSNGTPLIRLGMDMSKTLLIGALINYKACAAKAEKLARKEKTDIKILIPQTHQGECIEDLYAAGLIVKHLGSKKFTPQWDSTKIAMLLAETPQQRIMEELRDSQSAKRVAELGYKDDIAYSLQMNTSSLVPISKNSSIAI